MQYIKQNAGADLNWRPTKEWNLGAAYGFERYDWTQADVDYTNENSGKVYADWKPMSWFGFRSSATYSDAALRHLRLRRLTSGTSNSRNTTAPARQQLLLSILPIAS